jgi:hypothetical protein
VCVNATIVVFVNRAVCSQDRVVVAHFKVTLENVQTALKVNFLFDNIEQGVLDVARKRVEATNTCGRAVNSDVAEQVVFTG